MKRAVVSGATGFIGSHLAKVLQSGGVEVIALCRADSVNQDRLPKGISVINCMMDEYESLADRVKSVGDSKTVFFHLAWEGATGPGRTDAVLQERNVQYTLQAVKAAKAIGCSKFVATGTVYENLSEQIETANVFFGAAFYVMSKRSARVMSQKLALQLGIDFKWCTFCHPIGKYIKQEQLLAYAVESILKGVPPTFGPAENWFDVIDVEDLATGLYIIGEKELKRSEYYIGSGNPRVLIDYLTELPAILGVDTEVSIGARTDDGLVYHQNWFDSTGFSSETGFKLRYDYMQSILRLKDYLCEGLI